MSPSPSSERVSPAPPDETPPAADDFEVLRELILGREQQQLEGLQERLENPTVHARDVSEVLPQAVTLASSRGPQLANALTPAVESALKESVRRDPAPLVNAVFPIIGPAIRKAIAETFSKLVQSINQTLDHSLSLRGLRWRFEAARTGRSFAEVVLAHTLIYRVEQVMLIHRHAGLLLLHVRAPHVANEDAGMVSGLLTAIQDFARDSFHVPAGETLDTLQVGELTVWVETSPLVTLAAVIRGQAPREFRATLQTALETIHREHGAALETFDGDAAPFELTRPLLESCLEARFAGATRPRSAARLLVVGSVIVLLLATWVVLAARANRRWAGYLDRLKAEPGIVITEAGRHAGRYFVSGLRDPLAADPAELLPEFQITPERLVSRWEPYHALSPPLVLRRAARVLQPPEGVTLRMQDGALVAEGVAPAGWTTSARERATTVPGVVSFDTTGLIDGTQALLAARQREIEQTILFFDDGLSMAPGQEGVVDTLAGQIADLRSAASQVGQAVRVTVIGHTDESGTDELNQRLSRERADHIVSLLSARGIPAGLLTPVGVGPTQPWRGGDAGPDETRHRRVTFRVVRDQSSIPPPTP